LGGVHEFAIARRSGVAHIRSTIALFAIARRSGVAHILPPRFNSRNRRAPNGEQSCGQSQTEHS
jgi:hypothetical protein